MRLLECDDHGSFKLSEFTGDDPPPYAILSHTWGPDQDEVTFKDLSEITSCNKVGLQKLKFCGNEVAKDGLRYFWIDTCCIDKSSSTELSEAINSMFQWYQNSSKCYVFLTDVSTLDADDQSIDSQLRASRWFTRGWTLQELLAPQVLDFFSREGQRLGTKISLIQQIHEITGIATEALEGRPLSRFSIAERILWQKNRNTKRREDKAYSLLGIFGVHMPLIYGEGEHNAFRRLEEEINKQSKECIFDGNTTDNQVQVIQHDFDYDDRDEILSWISTEDYEKKHRAIRLPRVHGTGRWLLEREEYLSWRDGSGLPNALWCHGLQGTGKSVLTSLVVDQLRDPSVEMIQPLAFIYFDYRDSKNQTPARVLASILKQVISALPEIPSKVEHYYTEKRNSPSPPSLFEWNKVLSSVLESLPRAFIIIDALDECDGANRREFLDVLKSLQTIRNARLFLTSRSYPSDIQTALENIPKITIEAQDSDVRLYVQEQLKDTVNAGIIDSMFMEDIIKQLLVRSQGLFLLAALQVRMILNEPTAGDMEDALSRLSGNLAETFAETIARISRLPESRRRLAMTTLLWACHAKKLLTDNELIEALSVRLGQSSPNSKYRPSLAVILECCQGLVTIEPETRVIRLTHYSIQEYLVEQSELFGRGHAPIAETCLTYLLFDEFKAGPCEEEDAIETRMSMNPFFFFAATHGLTHARMAISDPTVVERIWRLFNSPGALASAYQAKRYGQGYREEYWRPEECLSATPLHFAANYGLTTIAEQLLENPLISVDVATSIGTTPMIFAASSGHMDIVRALAYRGANPYLSNWYGNALHCAAEAGCSESIRFLVTWGVDPNIRGSCYCYTSPGNSGCGRTPLSCTLDNDRAQATDTLLTCGADIRLPNCNGKSFFEKAVDYDSVEVVKMLLTKNYVNVNDYLMNNRTGSYTTALHIAAANYSETMIHCLLGFGANSGIKDSRGRLPIQYIYAPLRASSALSSQNMDL